jgi:hypothetical protein
MLGQFFNRLPLGVAEEHHLLQLSEQHRGWHGAPHKPPTVPPSITHYALGTKIVGRVSDGLPEIPVEFQAQEPIVGGIVGNEHSDANA